jgi:hypothetical protein
VTHYVTRAVWVAWCLGGVEPIPARRLRASECLELSPPYPMACGAPNGEAVWTLQAHEQGVRATCPCCEVLWDEAVGA